MASSTPILIIAPCYNEASNIRDFLSAIEKVCSRLEHIFEVVIVNDGSTDQTTEHLNAFSYSVPNITLTVLELDYNVGHQQAIFQGLLYAKTVDAYQVVVLDSDGQDDVGLIPAMIELKDCDVVHITRKKRKESFLFKFGYTIYKMIFRVLTGQTIHFGNFCMINKAMVQRATVSGFVHFPAFVSKFAQRRKYIEADRKKRAQGESKMNFMDLMHHAIKSFIEYAERLLMVCLWVFIVLAIGLSLFALYIIYTKFFTEKAILGWASTIGIGLFNTALIALSAFVIGTQLLKNSYSNAKGFNASITKKRGKLS